MTRMMRSRAIGPVSGEDLGLARRSYEATLFLIPPTDGDDVIFGTEDDDDIGAGAGDDAVFGKGGDDDLDGASGNDVLDGGGGRDFLLGGRGRDLLSGGADDDRLAGAEGDDVVNGDGGDDTLDGDAGRDRLFGGAGQDTIFGENGDDEEFGEAGRDELFGDAGDDRLDGGDGNDEIEGDAGADTLTGGAGADRFIFFLGRFNPSSPFAEHDVITDFEGAGVPGGDRVDLSGAEVVFVGLTDFDPVEGAALGGGGDGVVQLSYSQRGGRTTLVADENDDGVLDARDFTLEFEGEIDLSTDDFIDTLFITAGTSGDDRLIGTRGGDRLAGLAGNDILRGLGGDDTLAGGDGDDRIRAGAGFDEIDGGAGDDLLILGEFGSAFGGGARDTIFGSDVDSAFNQLLGEGGADLIVAGAGSATLDGGDGDDRLEGGAGNDFFVGGAGVDQFVFGANWGGDFIQDFEDGVEQIDLSATGLAFADLTIGEDLFGNALITSAEGTIALTIPVEQIAAADFIFG